MVKKNSDPKWLSDNYSFKRNARYPSKIVCRMGAYENVRCVAILSLIHQKQNSNFLGE